MAKVVVKEGKVGRKTRAEATGHPDDIETWAKEYEERYPSLGYGTNRGSYHYDPAKDLATLVIDRWSTG